MGFATGSELYYLNYDTIQNRHFYLLIKTKIAIKVSIFACHFSKKRVQPYIKYRNSYKNTDIWVLFHAANMLNFAQR